MKRELDLLRLEHGYAGAAGQLGPSRAARKRSKRVSSRSAAATVTAPEPRNAERIAAALERRNCPLRIVPA